MTISRRGLLAGAGAGVLGAIGIGRLGRLARAGVTRAPTRLVIIHKPCGTVPAAYDCAGSGGADFTLSPILEPFADLRDQLVVVDGRDIRKAPRTPFEDHGNAMVTFMTGGITYKAAGSDVALAVRASIDQLLAGDPRFAGDAPIGSLQLAADTRSAALFTRTLSYGGRGAPLPAEQAPAAAYARVFGTLADPALSPAALARARQRKHSVLDFARASIARMQPALAGAERARLDRHLASIREVERLLDRSASRDTGALERQIVAVDPAQLDAQHAEIGRAHLELVRVAFQCDLARVVTFGWASGQSAVNFSRLIPGVEDLGYHLLTHAGANRDHDEAAVHRWYNEHIAAFARSLRATPDVDGRTLLDNTLIVVWSEMRLGVHTFDGVPIQLIGGAGGRLVGNRLLRYDHRPTNDLWLAVARALGLPLDCFGDRERCTGRLADVFAPGDTAPISASAGG